jgi:hypothetical protein
VKVAAAPAHTVCALGCVVIEVGVFIVKAAALLVADPHPPVTTHV